MAKRIARRTTDAPTHVAARIEMGYMDINSLAPYEFNPRDNAKAVSAVAASIRNFGFLIPVVIDRDNVLVAGHTRVEAAKTLGLAEVPAVRAEHLTEEQVIAFRVIDNKVAELADWNTTLLATELRKLDSSGLVLTEFGWTRGELDCLNDLVSSDCLETSNLVSTETQQRINTMQRRAPSRTRIVIGELVFYISQTSYRNWVQGIRELHDFAEPAIIADIKERLGLPRDTD